VDFAVTTGRVPDVPAPCEPPSVFCEDDRSAEFEERIDKAIELEDGFETRAWLYALGALAAVLAGAGVAFARTATERRRDLFTDLGVGGVLWLIAGFLLNGFGGDGLVAIPTKPVFYPAIALLEIAGIGTLASPTPPPQAAPTRAPALRRAGAAARIAGFALAGVAVVFAILILGGIDDPCVAENPGWVDALVAPGLIAGVGSIVCGLVTLTQRRWVAAVIMLVPAPFAIFVAALSTACWN
jgi:hypothetical protein